MRIINVIEQCNRNLGESWTPLLEHSEAFVRRMPGREDSDAFCYSIEKGIEGYSVKTLSLIHI